MIVKPKPTTKQNMLHQQFEISKRIALTTKEEVEKIFQTPKTVLVTEFTTESANKFRADMIAAQQTSQSVIPVVIDSYGGEVYSLMSMVDTINSCTTPVATIATGKAMSCGAVLLTCGKKGMRYASPSTTIMIHEVAAGARGKVEEIKADVKEAERLNEAIFKLMAKNCERSEDYFVKMIHEKNHADWFLGVEEAKELGMIQHIKVPGFKFNLSISESFE